MQVRARRAALACAVQPTRAARSLRLRLYSLEPERSLIVSLRLGAPPQQPPSSLLPIRSARVGCPPATQQIQVIPGIRVGLGESGRTARNWPYL
jgi:hypothetical protein